MKDIRSYHPVDVIDGFQVCPGIYEINGATTISKGVNFTIHSQNATSCTLLLYREGKQEPFAKLPFPQRYRLGRVYSMMIFDLDIEGLEYAYEIDGPYSPEKGLLFDKTKPLLDPYAKAVTGQKVWGEQPDMQSPYRARIVKNDFDWGHYEQSSLRMRDLIIYELHVRGYTKSPTSHTTHPGTFDAIREKIPYLKLLGVNAVEMMPIFEFDETMSKREYNGRELLDFWGYNTVGFFAPNTSYAATDEHNHEGTELKKLIDELHKNEIDVILDVVFNHTAEGNEQGPSFCFKGLDNNIYYMLTPDGNYYNFSGCGNTLNCNHPIVRQMILDCLRYWVINYRVDGFRFDLASILGRSPSGAPLSNPPLLESLAYDPVLSHVKLIAEAWDAGGLYQVGSFPAEGRWAEWNGRYRDDMRNYLKGDYGLAPEAANRLSGSADLYTRKKKYRGYNSSVNFLTCHDGFSLYDLYSYNEKHNEENGWDNTDGADDNRSWNCGWEGETNDPQVNSLRRKMIRNAFAVLMCSRGTPMFLAGDEFGYTRGGNNNPYCQDNEISWLDWSLLDKNRDLFDFCSYMIHFRKRHRTICGDVAASIHGFPKIRAYTNDPETNHIDRQTKYMGIMFAGKPQNSTTDDIVYLAINVFWEDQTFALPALPANLHWHLAVNADTADCYTEDQMPMIKDPFLIRARSVAVFVALPR